MAKNERFLTVDIGATSIKLGEFEIDAVGQLSMTVFAHREYEEELSEETRMGVVEGVLRQMLMESGVKAKRTLVSLSGQSALMRFGRIANMKNDKKQIRQLAEFEAKRNLPFELDDICLDYQLIASNEQAEESNTLDVMSVVLKRDLVEQYTQAIRNVGLRPLLIDLAPIACYNCARANGIGEDNSSLVISIGGRSTNLLFIEGNRFFARSIPIAGYSITQQIAKEFGIGLPEAEELKRHHGFVDLGKDTAMNATSEAAAHIAKIIRNVMSRLHGEISRSINIHRQQGGTAPTAIYLTGGSSILTYCDVFFSQKFDLQATYFNPLTIVNLAPTIDREKLGAVGHMFSEVIGLAVRYVRPCPVEINLLPRKVLRQQRLSSKKPYFVAAMICLVAMMFVVQQGAREAAAESKVRADKYTEVKNKLEKPYKDITGAISDAEGAVGAVTTLNNFMLERTKWPLIVEEIFRAKPANVWIDNITPIMGTVTPVVEATVVVDTSGAGNGMGEMGMGMDMGAMSQMDMGMDMGMGGMGGAQAVTKMAIAGFDINAHTLAPKGVGMGVDPVLPAEPEYPFEVPEAEAAAETEATDDLAAMDENGEAGDGTEESAEQQGPKLYDQNGESLFVRNLQKSRLFSSDPQLTAMKTRVKSAFFDNGADFEVQVKLEIPMEAYPWTFTNSKAGRAGMGTTDGAGRAGRRRGRGRD